MASPSEISQQKIVQKAVFRLHPARPILLLQRQITAFSA
ncbi:Hypothetical protein BSSP1_II0840 [Brucella suis bv. 2]|nr:hypothetical protein BCA52141_II1771 [Brucella canis HSK A52141]AIB19540.1 Hypothetical protein BSSP3_II0852 [Brucella suis bv. 2]AIB22911.1 Hypothetical protein BSPT1_II0837 [Brucella suis bv. 2]AIB26267.1 Hypothetical protein BSPT2_II0838 [Brucella suis bv. 2]AIB29661.1 Hypothetical protein BSSP1_II0840 [Brucella suis bv. 2]